MSLQNIVNVTITRATAALTRVGFGTPLLMVTHDVIPDVAKLYGSPDEMITDGFTTSDPALVLAQAMFAQDPKLPQFVLGKRTRQPTKIVGMTPISPVVASTLYRLTVNGTNFDFTSDSTPTVSEITAGLAAAIDQDAWVTLTPYVVGDHVINNGRVYICVTAGTSGATGPTGIGDGQTDGSVVWDHQGLQQNLRAVDNTTDVDVQAAATPGGIAQADIPFGLAFDKTLFDAKDATPDPGIAADLTDIRNVIDDWYLVTGDWTGEAEAVAMATVIETLQRAHLWSCQDTDVLDSAVTTDVASVMNGSAYERSGMLWHSTPATGAVAGWVGKVLPDDPGESTWKFKTIAGQAFDTFTEGQLTALIAKKANHYIRVAGQNMTAEGVMHQGEFIDTVRGLDFVAQRIAEDVYGVLKAAKKIPYTDQGAASLQSAVNARLVSATVPGGGSGQIFATDPAPTTSVTLVADIPAATRGTRVLPDITFSATLAGAVHNVEVTGSVSP